MPNIYKAVLFDIDQTVIDFISWLKLTDLFGASREEHKYIFDQYMNEKISLSDTVKEIIRIWSANGLANKDTIDKEIQKWPEREGFKELINNIKASNLKVGFLSGCASPYYELLCEKYEIPNRYNANEFIYDELGNLVEIKYTIFKHLFLEEFVEQEQINHDEIIMIGDGLNDIPIFKKVGLSIVVDKENNEAIKKHADIALSDFFEINDYLERVLK